MHDDITVTYFLRDGSSLRHEVAVPLSAVRERHGSRVADLLAQMHQQATTNDQARRLLAETDWYAIRAGEGGAPIPPEIAAARTAARERVVDVDWTIDLSTIHEEV